MTSLPSGSDAGDLNALLVKAEAIRAILAAGVPLDAATLAALETVTVGGTVELGPTALAAIGAIDGGGGPGAGGATEATLQDVADTLASILTQDTTTATKAEAIRLLLAGTIAVSASSLPLPTGAATQTTLAAILAAIVAGIPLDVASLAALESITVGGTVELGATSLAALESITATGPLTDTQLRASPVPVSGTFYPGTQPVSGTVTVANPTTNPETGLAKDATLAALADVVDDILTQDTTTATKAEAIRALLAATLAVAGNVGSAATDSGNPVKVGGKYNATLPTFTDGQRADLQLGSRGSENVTLMQKDTANAILSGSPSDTLANAQTFLGVLAVPHVWDGTQWVRTRGDATNGSDVDVTRVVPGTGATNLGKAEDGAHASGDTGLYILAVRQASLAPTSQADGRYESVQTDEVGQLKVTAGRILRSTATITRPADTTAYAASDEISSSTSAPAVVQFTGCARVSGWGGVLQSVILIDSAGNTAPPNLELWLFDSSVTPDNDNAAFTPTDAEAAKCVAIIPLGTGYAGDPTVGATGNRVFTASGLGMVYQCSGGTSLYGRLVVRNAYTPISAETFQVILYVVPD